MVITRNIERERRNRNRKAMVMVMVREVAWGISAGKGKRRGKARVFWK